MICLLDTDVLIDVALDRLPFSEYSSVVLDLAEQRLIKAFIAWHSLSNFYYIVSTGGNDKSARGFIRELLRFISVAPTKTVDAIYASELDFSDYEDAQQVASARACRAEKIITRKSQHYKKSSIPSVEPKVFLLEFGE